VGTIVFVGAAVAGSEVLVAGARLAVGCAVVVSAGLQEAMAKAMRKMEYVSFFIFIPYPFMLTESIATRFKDNEIGNATRAIE
jgi:hypothetical protein